MAEKSLISLSFQRDIDSLSTLGLFHMKSDLGVLLLKQEDMSAGKSGSSKRVLFSRHSIFFALHRALSSLITRTLLRLLANIFTPNYQRKHFLTTKFLIDSTKRNSKNLSCLVGMLVLWPQPYLDLFYILACYITTPNLLVEGHRKRGRGGGAE